MKHFISLAILSLALLSCSITSDQKPKLAGGYSNYGKVSQEELTMFQTAVSDYDSTLCLTPQKVSRQVVAGMNYKFECRDRKKQNHNVIIFKPLPGRGNPKVVSLD